MRQQRLLHVECYSGYTYPERPESFIWLGEKHRVSRLEKEWREPNRRFFRVATENEEVFTLCYNESEHRWRLAR